MNLKNDQMSWIISLNAGRLKKPACNSISLFSIKKGNSIIDMERSYDDEWFYIIYIFGALRHWLKPSVCKLFSWDCDPWPSQLNLSTHVWKILFVRMWGELSYVLPILISTTVLLIYIIMNTTVSHTFVNNDWEKKTSL